MEAEHIQKVNRWLNELNRMNRDLERITSEIGELNEEYDTITDTSDRAGIKADALDTKLNKILCNADYHSDELEDAMLKVTAYLNKFVRTATKGLMSDAEQS